MGKLGSKRRWMLFVAVGAAGLLAAMFSLGVPDSGCGGAPTSEEEASFSGGAKCDTTAGGLPVPLYN